MILAWLAMLIFTFHACTHMVAAGDTWVAMACGRHFVNHGVDTIEPFSANSHRPGPTLEEIETWPGWARWIADKAGLETVKKCHPTGWVNQNWLTHVIFYRLSVMFGSEEDPYFNALVLWKFAIYILTVTCVYYTGRVLGVNPALSAVFACFAMFVGRSFLDVRPAGFSNLLVACFLLILVLTAHRNILYIWLVVPLTVLWCNVHGGYIYVFIMLMPFVVFNLLTSVSKKRFLSIGLKGVYHTIAAGIAAFVAVALFNPFHLTNYTHTFVISVSKHAERWRDIHEWHPAFAWGNPVGTGFPFLVMYILSIGLLILWLLSRLLKPKLLKAPKNELEAQKNLFTMLSTTLGCAAAVLICWVVFVSFSLLSLDGASFFLCAVFVGILLLSTFKSIHFIFLTIPFTLLALWSGNTDTGYAGRYIYPFVIVPAYVTLNIFGSTLSKRIRIKPENIAYVGAAGFVCLLLMVMIFDPFKSEKSIWHVTQFFHLRRTWHPKYEGLSPFRYTYLFSVLYIVNIASVAIWLAVPYIRRLMDKLIGQSAEEPQGVAYQLPRINLAQIVIAGLTIYMAIRSRRFIPIAAYAACPILAMLIDQMTRAISAARNFHGRNRLVVSAMPRNLQLLCAGAAAVIVLLFGAFWGLKFKHIYLDSWPRDTEFKSIFMRMTASDAKPFYAGRFIKDNKLKGKMFNYWTEGGFIAWAQQPDPNTGRTPLQLFMDGRAQAAYDRKAFDLWSYIISGGQITAEIMATADARKRAITANEYAQIGRWVSEQLRDEKINVWVVLMPAAAYSDPEKNYYHFVKGLEYNPEWPIVFLNNKQKLFVDIKSPQGKKLFEGITTGDTIYPNDFCKNLILGRTLLIYDRHKDKKRQGLDLAIKAFNLNPSPAPMITILLAANFPELRPLVASFCRNYYDNFSKNKDIYIRQDGYRLRAEAARLACAHLEGIARLRKNKELSDFYAAEGRKYLVELLELFKKKSW